MRPHPVVDDEPNEDVTYPRVITITTAPPTDAEGANAPPRRREPWTPRESHYPSRPRPEPPPQPTARSEQEPPAAPARPQTLTRTQQRVLAGIVVVCISTILAVIGWRIWSDPGRAASVESSSPVETPADRPAAGAETMAAAEAGSGAITAEIQVLQPTYTVAPGDTLGSIARRQGTTVEALASINKLENRNSLSVGQRLIIP